MRPKTIIITGVVIIIIICIGVSIFVAHNGSVANNTIANNNSGGTLPVVQVPTNTATSSLLSIGTSNGTVQVNNFYLSNPEVADGGETIYIASTSEYIITYSTIDSSFWIGIDPTQFDAVRPQAEQAFLSTLGISNAGACKLNVSVGVFYSATSSLSGQSFPLSFCGISTSSQ